MARCLGCRVLRRLRDSIGVVSRGSRRHQIRHKNVPVPDDVCALLGDQGKVGAGAFASAILCICAYAHTRQAG
jgi:hypothetical protein